MQTVSIAVLLGASAGPVHADPKGLNLAPFDSLDLPFDHAKLALTARGTTPSRGGDHYQDGSVTLAGAIPLFSSGLAGWRLLAQFRAGGELVQTTALPGGETISKDALGATALYLSHRHDLYAIHAGVALAESTTTMSHPTPMPTALGLGTYRSGSLIWIYGGGFGYTLGRSWLLPVGGVIWRVSPTWTLSTLLPIEAKVRHRFSPTLSLSLGVSVSGDLYHVANDGAFPDATTALKVHLAQLRTGFGLRYKLDARWSLRAEVGVVGPRRLQISSGAQIETSPNSAGAFYGSTGVHYAFDHVSL